MKEALKILKSAEVFESIDISEGISMDGLRDIFYALSDKIRLEIISMLIDNGEMCVCKFQEFFKISQPNLSFHLGILRKSGLVKTRRKGTWMNYSLNYENEVLKNVIPLIKKAK